MDLKKYAINYDSAIEKWDEALPLGNGKMGCLIYGKGPIRLSLDRVDLWDTRPHPNTLEKAFNYKNLVKYSTSGKEEDWAERARLFEIIYSGNPYPSKITAGRIELDFGKETDNIRSNIDLKTAIANVAIENGELGSIQSFMSATRFVGVAKVYGNYTLDIHIPDYISGAPDEASLTAQANKKGLYYPRAEIVRDGEFIYYAQETFTELRYGVIVLQKQCGDHKELYFTIATNVDYENFIEGGKAELEKAYALGYETLKKEHIAWWKRYWKMSEVNVGDELIERTYYRSWYLFASCSRKGFYPMPLQGVWTADNDCLPPWKGDYHHDTNTQLSYQAFLKANRMDEGRVFIDYLWTLRKQFRKVAREFYGVKGLIIPGVSTIDGKPMGGWSQYALSPTMSIWSAQSFDEYYLYTGDIKFLKERAYPFLKDVGDAIYGLLEERNGKLYLPLSTSPEIHDANPEAYLTPNSNFDLALIIYLYRTLKNYTEILGLDGSLYDTILSKLDDIATNESGKIMLSPDEHLTVSHRHFSHLMCLYPLHVINYDTPEHQKIYQESLWELERLGMGAWVGFSYGMCAQIYAMALNGNGAYEKLRVFSNCFVAENGFHLNGDFKNYGVSLFHYRPFTLESSFGYCDALHEMLMQDHQGYVHLFPAIPLEWQKKKLAFKKLRSVGGVLISAEYQNGKTRSVTLEKKTPQTVKIKNTFGKDIVTVKTAEGAYELTETDGYFVIEITGGKVTVS